MALNNYILSHFKKKSKINVFSDLNPNKRSLDQELINRLLPRSVYFAQMWIYPNEKQVEKDKEGKKRTL